MEALVNGHFNSVWDKYLRIYPRLLKFERPIIELNPRSFRTAGICYVEENRIQLSKKLLLSRHREEMLQVVLPHEVAHQVDFNFHGLPKRWHRESWKQIMRDYGLPPNLYHDMTLP